MGRVPLVLPLIRVGGQIGGGADWGRDRRPIGVVVRAHQGWASEGEGLKVLGPPALLLMGWGSHLVGAGMRRGCRRLASPAPIGVGRADQ